MRQRQQAQAVLRADDFVSGLVKPIEAGAICAKRAKRDSEHAHDKRGHGTELNGPLTGSLGQRFPIDRLIILKTSRRRERWTLLR